MNDPSYYVAVFGEPEPPGKDKVDSGIHHPDENRSPFPTKPGDILLLYCTGSYIGHFMQVPGVGIVIETKSTSIHYRYLPFSKPISKDEIDANFDDDDKERFKLIRFSSHWLFEISRNSFTKTIGKRSIAW